MLVRSTHPRHARAQLLSDIGVFHTIVGICTVIVLSSPNLIVTEGTNSGIGASR